MTDLVLFKSNHSSIKYVFRDGSFANFIKGKFYTDREEHVKELEGEVKLRHPHIYIDSKEPTIDPTKLDDRSKLKDSLRAEILDEMMRKSNPENDFGSSFQGALNPSSTIDISPVSAGGDGAQLATKLKALVASTQDK